MYRVDLNTNDITITRGDSALIKLTMDNSDGTPFQPGPNDHVEFQCCQGSKILFQKDVKQGVVTVVPTDTNKLEYGTYSYRIIVNQSDGKQLSAVNGAKFIVEEEVTY